MLPSIPTIQIQTLPSAILDIKSSNKGFFVPRIALTSSADITTIASLATSLLIYNTSTTTDLLPDFYYFNETKWVALATTSNTTTGRNLSNNA